jgi:hypothetical protein
MKKFFKWIMLSPPTPQKLKEAAVILMAWLAAIALVYIVYQKVTNLFHK